MTAEQTIERLHQLPRVSAGGPKLERMRQLMERLGNPQNHLKFIHVAGTNGKGTVCALTAAILTEAGFKTGLTISPYVLEFRERFQIDGEMIPPETLVRLAERVLAACEAMGAEGLDTPGEFEVVTAIAFLWFAEEQCDLVVMETGLGGRFDATNVVETTLVVAITRIGFDHTEMLGNTLEQIAREKCGIIKDGCTLVCYPEQPKEALREIVVAASQHDCEWILPEMEDFTFFENKPFRNKVDYGGYTVKLPFPGRHQSLNMAMAVEICLALWRKGYDISDEAILVGLESAFLPARMEVLQRHPLVVLDGCHNPDGAEVLAAELKPIVEDGGKVVAVMGMMADKDVKKVMENLEPVLDKVYTVAPAYPRAMPVEELTEIAKYYFEVQPCDSVEQALRQAMQEDAAAIVVCGSLYLAAEARPKLMELCQ